MGAATAAVLAAGRFDEELLDVTGLVGLGYDDAHTSTRAYDVR